MIKLIDCSFDYLSQIDIPEQFIQKRWPGYGYVEYIQSLLKIIVIGHINSNGNIAVQNASYSFFKGGAGFFHIPFGTLRYIKNQNPDVIITQGLIFPFQVIALRMIMGKNCRIVTQHHGEKPFSGIKRILQKLADGCTDGYLFSAYGNAAPWIERKIIHDKNKCLEVMEASSYLKRKDKDEAIRKLNMNGGYNFLWVGRLNLNKDPWTVLIAFEEYLSDNPSARLYMIYQEDELLNEISGYIGKSKSLSQTVFLLGKIDYAELPDWYSAADFFISGSHSEGSGYALLEAMSCGCIPVVTDIPSFRKITADGKFGYLYPPGNAEALLTTLNSIDGAGRKNLPDKIMEHFSKELSFERIAERLAFVCEKLLSK